MKKALLDRAAGVFEEGPWRRERESDALVDRLYWQIRSAEGRAGFFAREVGPMSRERRRALVERSHRRLSVAMQCKLLRLSRSSVYCRRKPTPHQYWS